jgi:hypothetical protein
MVRKKQQRSLRPSAQETNQASFVISLRSPSPNGKRHAIEVQIMEEPQTLRRLVLGLLNRFKLTFCRVQFQTTTPQAEASPSPRAVSNMKLVKNLCPLFCGQSGPMSSLGFNLDPKGRLYGTYQPSSQLACPSEHLVSLEELLSKSTSKSKRRALTDEDRYFLAITLASSLLQLHTTPWLRGSWSKRDILFSDTHEEDSSVIDVRHPVILNTHGCVVSEAASRVSTGRSQAYSDLMRDSASLLTLAKVLLEIKLNDQFETQQQGEDLGTNSKPNEATDIRTLMRWITEEEGNLSFTYRNVVSHCIKCSVDPSTNLRDLVFRQTLVDRVVVPLLEELHIWQGGIDH